MALRIKGHGGHAPDQQEYDIFWTEFRAIEESRSPTSDEDHDEESSKEPPGGTLNSVCRVAISQLPVVLLNCFSNYCEVSL